MRYAVHERTEPPESGELYDDRAAAGQAAKGSGRIVSVILSDEERANWRNRELARFEDGTYRDVPWSHDAWYEQYADLHYCHWSINDPGQVAYTPSEEYGIQDRQIRVRTGRYLSQFAPGLPQERIDRYCAKLRSGELQITQDADTIAKIYLRGPQSCMDARGVHLPSDFLSVQNHPARVYAGPDLAVAFLGDPDYRVTARSVVWPDKHTYSRVYGDVRLIELLENAGYVQSWPRGARIRAIEYGDGYLMPYIDGIDYASERGQYLVLDCSGRIDTQITCGCTDPEPHRCRNCERTIADDDEFDGLCYSCYDRSWMCDRCNETHFDDANIVDGESYCDHCYSRLNTCEVCGDRTTHDQFCSDCDGLYHWCDDCDSWIPNGESCDCEDAEVHFGGTQDETLPLEGTDHA